MDAPLVVAHGLLRLHVCLRLLRGLLLTRAGSDRYLGPDHAPDPLRGRDPRGAVGRGQVDVAGDEHDEQAPIGERLVPAVRHGRPQVAVVEASVRRDDLHPVASGVEQRGPPVEHGELGQLRRIDASSAKPWLSMAAKTTSISSAPA
ncbi:hypothetical protein [Pseudonocardia acidicola]|uniref:Secreted protein n=1 Tax=Pseudonocardia acidicola TaxID=2724939 RepID=A0ABX1S7J2_9PSEU|nr:hypothetical protein [Pseudonocardia acidicola]NMH96567.1 hypothetical protein [Pseudonocardia acidicola]